MCVTFLNCEIIFAGQLEYTINELDKSVPGKLKENLQNITRRMDRIRNNTDFSSFVYRSKDYEYGLYYIIIIAGIHHLIADSIISV